MYYFLEFQSAFNLENRATSNIKIPQVLKNLALNAKLYNKDGDCLNHAGSDSHVPFGDVRSANDKFSSISSLVSFHSKSGTNRVCSV